jgi:1-acyl-sn-glycerol-3-phosphate acyltransferase
MSSWAILGYCLAAIFTFNALVGIAMYEFALYDTRRARKVDEKRDSLFPAWRRLDTHKISRVWNYPAAMVLLPLRFEFFVAGLMTYCFFLTIIRLVKKVVSLPSVEEFAVKAAARGFGFFCTSLLYVFFIIPELKQVDCDYTKYLGTDYKKNLPPVPPTIVSNHTGPVDIPLIISLYKGNVAFAASSHLSKVPFLSWTIEMMGGMYIDRTLAKDKRDLIVEKISERQNKVMESGKSVTPLVIFPEGHTTNNTMICNFKRGAFCSNQAIRPIALKY